MIAKYEAFSDSLSEGFTKVNVKVTKENEMNNQNNQSR